MEILIFGKKSFKEQESRERVLKSVWIVRRRDIDENFGIFTTHENAVNFMYNHPQYEKLEAIEIETDKDCSF